jgi:hypothetical protein
MFPSRVLNSVYKTGGDAKVLTGRPNIQLVRRPNRRSTSLNEELLVGVN